MSWKPEVEGLAWRRQQARQHGGDEAVAKQHAAGRLTVRERVDALLDEGSFRERGGVAGWTDSDDDGNPRAFIPANYVLGSGRIDGRPCVVGGEDFTQKGGSPSPAGLRKSVHSEDLAVRLRVPLVRFLEGAGGSVAGTAGRGERPSAPPPGMSIAPHRFASIAEAMRSVPVASAAMGAVAGFPAARLVASHFSVMARDTAQVLIGGPALVERAMGERASKDELGGARVHLRSGVVDNAADDEAGCCAQIRRFLSYLPSNVWQPAPLTGCDDPRERRDEELLSIIPRDRRKVYAMRDLIAHVVDWGSFFEMTARFGRAQITGFARLGGRPVGLWANDTRFYAGAMSADGARKVRRFVDLCDTFGLPIVALVDEPGFMIGAAAEKSGTIRHGAEALFAVVQSTVPWASVIVRKAYGVAAAAHFGPGGLVLAWPSAESGALPIEGGVAVAFRRVIAESEDPEAKRAELEARMAAGRTPFPRAEVFGVVDLIDPRETRPALCDWVESVEPALRARLGPRGHSIRP